MNNIYKLLFILYNIKIWVNSDANNMTTNDSTDPDIFIK